MIRSELLTIQNLIDELGMGKATLKFILHRFNSWLAPHMQIVNNETCYSEQTVPTLLKIKKFLDSGLLPEQIEESLAQQTQQFKDTPQIENHAANPGGFPVDMQSASVFKEMLQIFIEKQDRIALAQETLARVEERKADAMEKRAAAEEKKAVAMTNIALALQQMNERYTPVASDAMEIAGKAVEILTQEETCDLDKTLLDTDLNSDPHILDSEQLFENRNHGSLGDIKAPGMDDLSLLVNDNALTLQEIDDLSALIDSVSCPARDLDDLASLLDVPEPAPEQTDTPANSMDDLSKLVDMVDHEDIDDLSKLIDHPRDHDAADLDDLYALIEQPAQFAPTMDDLSLLIGGGRKDTEQVELDDLSSLVSDMADFSSPPPKPAVPSVEDPGMDNLSALLTDIKNRAENKIAAHVKADIDIKEKFQENGHGEIPSIKPDISPDQDMGKYKAAVMKIIIELKSQGFTAQQATDRLNRDGVATLSGKPAWGLKAIEKIYGFIDSAK